MFVEKILSQTEISSRTLSGQTLFHGSRAGILGKPSVSHTDLREGGDFGKAFYLGSNKGQAMSLVCSENSPVFYTFEFNQEDLKVASLSREAWLTFIAMNRGWFPMGTVDNLKKSVFADVLRCDVIIGDIADDRMETMLIEFQNDRITDAAFMAVLKAARLGRQHGLKTQKACDSLVEISREKLSPEKRKRVKESSYRLWSENMKNMDAVLKANLRNGIYFSEMKEKLEEELNARQSDSLHLQKPGGVLRPRF